MGVCLFLSLNSSQSPRRFSLQPYATSRSSHSRRSLFSCRFFPLSLRSPLPRSATTPLPADPLPSPLGATLPSSQHILAPRVYRAISSRKDDSSDAHCDHLPPSHIVAQVHSLFEHSPCHPSFALPLFLSFRQDDESARRRCTPSASARSVPSPFRERFNIQQGFSRAILGGTVEAPRPALPISPPPRPLGRGDISHGPPRLTRPRPATHFHLSGTISISTSGSISPVLLLTDSRMQQQSRRPSPASLRGITRTTRESQKEQSTTRAWPEPRWREPRRRVQRPGGGAKGGERARLRTLRRGRGEGDVEAAAVPDASLHASAAAGGGCFWAAGGAGRQGGGRGRKTGAGGGAGGCGSRLLQRVSHQREGRVEDRHLTMPRRRHVVRGGEQRQGRELSVSMSCEQSCESTSPVPVQRRSCAPGTRRSR